MDIKDVIENTGEALTDSVNKVTASISPGLANLADTQIGKQVASIVTAAGEKAEEALEKSHVREAASSVSLPAPADLVENAKEAVHPSNSSSHKAVIVGGTVLAAGAAAAAGVVVYRRRQAGQAQDDAEAEGSEGAVVTPIQPDSADASADADSGDSQTEGAQPADKESQVTDQSTAPAAGFAAQLDAEADHFATDLVDHIDDEEAVGGVLDIDYAIELDAEADHFAKDFVDHIEVTDEELPEEK